MNKNNTVKLLMIALVAAILATGIFYSLFVNKLSSSTGNGKTLVVAAKALKPGAVISAADVKTILWAAPVTPKGSFETVDQVAGKTVFDIIGEDEPILESRLASHDSGGGSGVPSGMRAVSVHVSDSTGVMALLRAGQKVDVQVVVGHGNSNETTVRTAIEDLKVLSVNTQPEGTSQGLSLPVVTLLAKPSQADVLAAADSGARVRLTLRNPLDEDTRGGSALSLGTVMRASGAASSNSSSSDAKKKRRGAQVVEKPAVGDTKP